MNHRLSREEAVQLAIGVLLAAATFTAFAIGSSLGEAAFSGGLILALVLLVLGGRRRSGTLDVMSGIGDERSRTLYTRATSAAGTVMAFVIPGWWLVTVAQGRPDQTLSLLGAIFGVSFVVAVAVFARRG